MKSCLVVDDSKVIRKVARHILETLDFSVSEAVDGRDALRAQSGSAAVEALSEKDLGKRIKQLEKQMLEHARNLEFEQAARLRDQLALLKEQAFGAPGTENVTPIQAARPS